MSLDLATRKDAIPFLGQIAGYNRSDVSDADVTQATALGDLFNLAAGTAGGTPAKDNLIRIMKPQFATITSAYWLFSLTFANAETSKKVYLTAGSGYSANPGVTAATPTLAEIIDRHTRLTGSAAPLTALASSAGASTVSANLNLMDLIPKPTDANYRDDCFVVGVHFLQTPLNATGYLLNKFQLNLSGVITHG